MPTVETNGVQTYYEEYGNGSPVIFLHGAESDHRLWAEQIRPLADDYRIIVYNLRGHGLTGGSALDHYTKDVYVKDLKALITNLELDDPAICGISLGGMIALMYASEYSNTISALVTLGTETPETLTYSEWIERQIPKIVDALSTVVDRDRLINVKHRIDEWRYDERGAANLEGIKRIQQDHGEDLPEPSEAESRKVHEMLKSYPSESVDYSAITVPALHLYGEYEIELLSRHANHMASEIPRAKARQIPNAGHSSHVDNPEFIVESLREFLASTVSHGSD